KLHRPATPAQAARIDGVTPAAPRGRASRRTPRGPRQPVARRAAAPPPTPPGRRPRGARPRGHGHAGGPPAAATAGAGARRWPAPAEPAAMDASENKDPASLTQRPQWTALRAHAGKIAGLHLRELFAADPARGQRLSAEGAGLYLDYSKQRVDEDALRLLLELAEACGVRARTAAMFAGERINRTEDRSVLHVALRM